MSSEIVGRDEELAAIGEFLAGPLPAALLLQGEAGAGKTTLWRAALARAGGFRVLSCVAARAEAQLAFVALADLLGGVSVAGLPAPQQRALEAALLRADPGEEALNPRAVAAGLLGMLRRLADEGPLLVAIDDVQWLDGPSAAAFAFAARRVADARIGLLMAWRTDGSEPAPLGLNPRRVDVGPLSLGAIHRLLSSRLGVALARPALRRVHAASGGNPFFALELGRALLRRGGEPGPLPMPTSLAELVRERLAALPAATREALMAVAAEGGGSPTPALDPAVEARVLESDGLTLRFSHPLLASAVYAGAPPAARRAVHRRLADAARGVEERARHLSLATVAPDTQAAAEVARGAEHALARGAPAACAELLEHAVRLTPPSDEHGRFRRTLQAVDAHYEAGDARRARQMAEALVETAAAGPERAEALSRLGTIVGELDGPRRAGPIYHAALAEAGEDPALQARTYAELARHAAFSGDARAGLSWARSALEHAERAGGDRLLADVAPRCAIAMHYADEIVPEALIRRALALEAAHPRPHPEDCATSVYGELLLDRCELDAARECFGRLWRMARDHGDETNETGPLFRLVLIEMMAGRWDEASLHLERLAELAQQSGVNTAYAAAMTAFVDAHRGREDAVRGAAAAGLAGAAEQPILLLWWYCNLGFLELSLGNPREASDWFARWERLRSEIRLQDVRRNALNATEAFVEAGRLEEAAALLDGFVAQARKHGDAIRLPLAGRARGLLRAARGDLEGGVAELERAVAAPELVRLPFERARTLLVHGRLLRRAKRKRAAREALEQALAEFERLGAALWAQRAHAELARVAGRAPARERGLTETERRIADLAGEGRSNKQIAAELFVSVRTVEANLTRVYGKLGVRGRAELASRHRG